MLGDLRKNKNTKIAKYKKKDLTTQDESLLPAEYETKQVDINIEEPSSTIQDYIDILIRRKWIIISCLVISLVTVAISTLMMPKIYKAYGTIEISPIAPQITSFEKEYELAQYNYNWEDLRKFYETQYKIIKSQSLAKVVVGELKNKNAYTNATNSDDDQSQGLFSLITGIFGDTKNSDDNSSKEASQKKSLKQTKEERKSAELRAARAFLGGIGVKPDRKSRLVEISYESADPEFSSLAVNTLIDKYIEWILVRRHESSKVAKEFLKKQLDQSKGRLERSEEELSKFAKGVDVVSLDKDLNLVYIQLEQLNKALAETETERLTKEAIHNDLNTGNYQFLPQIVNDESIQHLNETLTELKGEYENKSVVYGPNYPEIKQLGAQIARIQSEIDQRINHLAESIKRDYQAALTKENVLRERTKEQNKRASILNDKAIQYKILEREVDSNKAIYDTLLTRLKETEITSGIDTTNVQVVDYAATPKFPFKPSLPHNLLYALIFGLMVGGVLAIALEQLDSTIKDEEEVKRRYALPVMGSVPLVSGDKEVTENIEQVVYTAPKSIISESFRVIRTSILYSSPEHAPEAILITSTQPLEGKTTSASNLSLSLIQSGLRVVLVDADLRKPRIEKIFLKEPNGVGLSTYLVGKAEVSSLLHKTEFENLDIIPSGPIPPNPAELIGSLKMRELIVNLTEQYDHVILDGAPISNFADSRLLSRYVDGVLIVTSVGITQRESLKTGMEEITKVGGNIIGTIVNRVDSHRNKLKNSYYYYYSDEGEKHKKRPSLPSNNS